MKKITELASELTQATEIIPAESNGDSRNIKTTQKHAARLLEIASDPSQDITAHRQDIEALVLLVANRAIAWKKIATDLQRKTELMSKEAKEIQQLAEDLANISARLTETQAR